VVLGNEKSDGVNEGVIISDEPPEDTWLGMVVAVVMGNGDEKGPGEAINNSVSMI
jgi:co-chaperonin GroES (HSP10)